MKAEIRTIARSMLAAVVLALPLSILPHGKLCAQGDGGDALLHDYTERFQYVGGGVGYSYWQNEADFGVTDRTIPCSRFTDGDGGGPVFELKAMLYPFHNTWFIFSPRIRYEARSGTFISPLPGEPVKGENSETVILQQEGQVDATLSTVSGELMVAVEFAETGFYVVAGGAGGLLLDGVYDYTERLLAPQGFVYAATETNEQQLLGGRQFDNFSSYVLDLRGGLGYMYRLNDFFALNVEALYSYPLTSVFEAPDVLKQQGVISTLSLLYNIGD